MWAGQTMLLSPSWAGPTGVTDAVVLQAGLPKRQSFIALNYCLWRSGAWLLTSSADISGKKEGEQAVLENCGLLRPITLNPPHLELHTNSLASEAKLLPDDPSWKIFITLGGWPVPPQSARLSTVVCVSKRVDVRLQWFCVSLRSTVSQKGNRGKS